MKKITSGKEIQQIELGILEKIHAFCIEHKLRYSLYGGTLIGAIRHKGFIPWDDDIDICMPRPDYEIFCREFRGDDVSLRSIHNDKNYNYPFAKVYDDRTVLIENSLPDTQAGIYVDVFPIDGLPKRGSIALWATHMCSSISLSWHIYKGLPLFRRGRAFHKQMALLFFRSFLWIFPKRFLCNAVTNLLTRFDYEKMSFRGNLIWGYGMKEVLPAKVFETFDVPVEFEGKTFFAMSGWHEYLTSIYGDYMTPPPPEKRVSNHNFTAYWKNEDKK